MKRLRSLWRARSGAIAAEFALVLPLLLILIFGLIDAGRLLWTMNRAEKAVQAGARVAAVTNVVPAALRDYDFVSETNPPGSPVSTSRFGAIECDIGSSPPTCRCVTEPCLSATATDTGNTAAYSVMIERMQGMMAELDPADVSVRFEGVGLGYAGNPYGSDISPLVTVELSSVTFRPITLMVFGAAITLPDFRAGLTMEDGSGTTSN